MAVLPDPDAVGQIDTESIRRAPIGQWQPGTIERAGDQMGQSLEHLGSTLGQVGVEEQNRQNALQVAQAKGDAYAQGYTLRSQAEQSTDPAVIANAKQQIPTIFSNAAAKISNPYTRQMFMAEHEPVQAQWLDSLNQRGRTLDNQNALGHYMESSDTIINNAVLVPDDATSAQGLNAIQVQLKGLEVAGVITEPQRVEMGQTAVKEWATARYDHLVAMANAATDPASRQAAQAAAFRFGSGFDPSAYFSPDGTPLPIGPDGRPLVPSASTPSQTAADGSPLPPPKPPEFGGAQVTPVSATTQPSSVVGTPSPAGGPWVASSDGKSVMATDAKGNVVPNVAPISATPKSAPPNAAAGPAAYPALGGFDVAHTQAGGSMAWERQGPPPQGYGAINVPYNRPLDAKGPSGMSAADIYQTAIQHGASTNEALMLAGGAANESGFNANAWHDNKTGYGLFGHKLDRLNLVGLGPEQQIVEALNEVRRMPNVEQMLQNAKSPADVAAAEMAYEAPQGYTAGHPEAGHNYTGRLHTLEYFSQMANGVLTGSNGAPVSGQTVAGPGRLTLPDAASLTPLSYLQQQMPIGLPAQAVSFDSIVPPNDDATPAAAPPQSRWPSGAQGVSVDPDGSLSYRMEDGSQRPVLGSGATGMPFMQLPPPPAGSVAAMLPAPQRAEMQLKAVNQMREWQRQDALAGQRSSRADVANIEAVTKQMVAGSRLTSQDGQDGQDGWQHFSTAYANSPDPDTRDAYAKASAIHQTLSTLWGVRPAQVAASATAMSADFDQMVAADPTDRTGRLTIVAAATQAAQEYAKAYSEDVAKDPLGRAAREGVIPPPKALDPTSPTFGDDVADRIRQTAVASTFFGGSDVPVFRPQERLAMRQVMSAGGQPLVNAVTGIVDGAGAQAPTVFKQLGVDAPGLTTLGHLALDPNADHSVVIGRIASYLHAMHDPEASKSLVQVKWQDMYRANQGDPYGGALDGMGADAISRLHEAAAMLVGESATTNHYDPKADPGKIPPEEVQRAAAEAVGGTMDAKGMKWGGIGNVPAGGSMPWSSAGPPNAYSMLVPTDMNPDKVGDVLQTLSSADIAKMPTPYYRGAEVAVPAQAIKNGQLQAVVDSKTGMFDGRYNVVLGNGLVLDKKGQPWTLDLGMLGRDQAFRDRVPGAYMQQPPGGRPWMQEPAPGGGMHLYQMPPQVKGTIAGVSGEPIAQAAPPTENE